MRCGHFKAAEGHNFAHFGARNESFRDASSEIDSLGELRELDWLRLKVTLCLLRAASAHSDPHPIVLNLIKLDAFTKRYRLHQLPGLLESKVPSLLLDLSLADHHKIRALSLSILSNLTALIPDFLYQFDPMAIADSVHCNLLHPFFPGRSCVFLWLGNILKSYPDLLPHLTDRVPLADISDSAVELVVQDETNRPESDIFVLLGTHSLLGAVAIPAEARLELVESLQLPEFLGEAIRSEVTEATFVAAAILADICELGLPVEDGVVEMLDVVHAVSCADSSKFATWHPYLYGGLARVLGGCGEEVLFRLWNANGGVVLGDLGAAWRNGSFAQKGLVAECLFVFVNGLPVEEVVTEEAVEVMFEIVEADGQWMEEFVEAVKRMADLPEFQEVFQAVNGLARVADWETEVAALNDVLREVFAGDDAFH